MEILDSDSKMLILFVGGLILLYVFLTIFTKSKQKRQDIVNYSIYHLRKSILTKNELEFYEILERIVEGNLVICPMVRLADIFSVDSGKGSQSALNRINSRHVDFLLCQKETLTPFVAIELDDKSHQRVNRIKRDEFVNQLFEHARLPLLRYPAKQSYSVKDVGDKLNPILKNSEAK